MSDFIDVKLIQSIVYSEGVWPKGSILHVTPDYAKDLIADGKAEEVKAEAPKAAKVKEQK